jgi:hypothetical protein
MGCLERVEHREAVDYITKAARLDEQYAVYV